MSVHKHTVYSLEPKKQPRLTKEQWDALLVIGTVILVFIAWFLFSFMFITSPYGG